MSTLVSELVGILKVKLLPYRNYLYPIYRIIYMDRIIKKRNRIFLDNSVKVMEKFDNCMSKNGITYTLAFGTLLGAIREKGFIKHDLDIDTIIWAEDYSEIIRKSLEQVGFKLIHEFIADGGKKGREETYQFLGVNIDIFYMYPCQEKLPYCCLFSPLDGYGTCSMSMKKEGRVATRRVELPITKGIKLVEFENLNLPVPINAEEILEYRYGKDYMIPNPDWQTNEGVIWWDDVNSVYFDYQ